MASQARNGKAFEWAVGIEMVNTFGFELKNDDIAKYNKACYLDPNITETQRKNYQESAKHAVKHILDKEKIADSSGTIHFLPDSKGAEGDVRDIVITTRNKEIGISCKTNHEAFKHSRLSKENDFVKRWGLDCNGCSEKYFKEISPIFVKLKKIRNDSNRTAKWADIDNVPDNFYWPILNAFADEIKKIESPEMCQNFIKYIVGRHDFYKVISTKNKVLIQAFNINKTLNTSTQPLPTKIDFIKDKNGYQYSKTISFDKGWVFNFRIHSASSRVEASLKFDVNALALSYKHYTHHIDY